MAFAASPASLHHHTCFAMNTRFSMLLLGIEAAHAETLFQATERQLRLLEQLMSRFAPHGPLAEINENAALHPVAPPEELWQILLLCRHYWQQTNGAFDITLRPLQNLWHNAQRRNMEPTEGQLAAAVLQTGFDKLVFDETDGTVHFTAPQLTLDLGGFGKGYALDQIADMLRKEGVQQAFLSFGESSITVLGSHPHGPAWPVGIPNLFNPAENLRTFPLKDASLSTSGATPANQQQSLILNPRSARPISGPRTLSVAAPTATEAEVLSTALLVTLLEERATILTGFPNVTAAEIVYHASENIFTPETHWTHGL